MLFGLFPHFTVEENIGLVPKLSHWTAAAIDERVRELLELVELIALILVIHSVLLLEFYEELD